MEIKKTIFISYGRDTENPQHVETVIKIKRYLQERGFNVLMDKDRLTMGNTWSFRLEDDISQSDWVLFFITPYSCRRPDSFCLRELAYAQNKKIQIAPVMIAEEIAPLIICHLQYLDLLNIHEHDEVDESKLTELVSVLSNEKELGFEGQQAKILHDINPLSSKHIVAKHIHGFIGREWVYNEVNRWLIEDKDSRVLWITAEAGYGKTALSTHLLSHPSSISIYYCQHDHSESQDPLNMLKVLIYQLNTQIPEYSEKLTRKNLKDILNRSAEHVFIELLVELLGQIKRPDNDLLFIIDALDEAKQSNGDNPILELISKRFSDLPQWLNIVITSRPEPEIIRKLNKYNPLELKTTEQDNLDDLKKFILEKFENLDDTIIKALLDKSEGNILYLKNTLERDTFKDGIFSLEDIQNIPDEISGFYLTFFERKFNDVEKYEDEAQAFIDIMVASKNGLPSDLIMSILNLKPKQYKKIIENFGSLLEENNTIISFYHKSLFDWLNDYDLSGDYSADVDAGHNLIFEQLWTRYEREGKNNLIEYADYLVNTLESLNESEKVSKIIKDLHEKDSDEGIVNYIISLSDLARSHYNTGHIKKAIELYEEILIIVKDLFAKDSDRWADSYTEILHTLSSFFKYNNELEEAIIFEQESLIIIKASYRENPLVWSEKYVISLNSLAGLYLEINRVKESIELIEVSSEIAKACYSINADVWVEMYINNLDKQALLYKHLNQSVDAIALYQESTNIIKEYYDKEPDKWTKVYLDHLNKLARLYQDNNQDNDATEILYVHSEVSKMLYSATFTDLLYLAKGIAYLQKADEISTEHFLNALGFIELEEFAKEIFSQIINVDSIPEYEDAQQLIEAVKNTPKLLFSEILKEFIHTLIELFGDKPIGVFR